MQPMSSMQYPQIQFYRGSLVRLPSGKLKQVEELSSDDFLDNALLLDSHYHHQQQDAQQNLSNQHRQQTLSSSNSSPSFSNNQPVSLLANNQQRPIRQQAPTDVNNNNINNNSNSSIGSSSDHSLLHSAFRRSSSPNAMETEVLDEEVEDYYIVEHDVEEEEEEADDDEDEELDVVTADERKPAEVHHFRGTNSSASSKPNRGHHSKSRQSNDQPSEDLCIGLSVVKDFLEVSNLPSSVSPVSSTGSNSLTGFDATTAAAPQHYPIKAEVGGYLDLSCKSTTTTTNNKSNNNHHNHHRAPPNSPPVCATFNQTVLIKFALGVDSGNRNIVFNEVPIDQPFFVFQRGWSSWNPQRTYDKFGLKCRKLKIGDTCISLFRKQRNAHPVSQAHHNHHHQQHQLQQPLHHPHQLNLSSPLLPTGGVDGITNKRQQDSDQCNILFSTIKLV